MLNSVAIKAKTNANYAEIDLSVLVVFHVVLANNVAHIRFYIYKTRFDNVMVLVGCNNCL